MSFLACFHVPTLRPLPLISTVFPRSPPKKSAAFVLDEQTSAAVPGLGTLGLVKRYVTLIIAVPDHRAPPTPTKQEPYAGASTLARRNPADDRRLSAFPS